jgi:putative addiction module component (TIGR02574 family)
MLPMTRELDALLALPLPERLAAAEAAWDAAPPDAAALGLDDGDLRELRRVWLESVMDPEGADGIPWEQVEAELLRGI